MIVYLLRVHCSNGLYPFEMPGSEGVVKGLLQVSTQCIASCMEGFHLLGWGKKVRRQLLYIMEGKSIDMIIKTSRNKLLLIFL